MDNVTFNMARMHRHGTAFWDFLRLRKSFFVDGLKWDIPHDEEVEMDQYDNPQAHYSVVLMDGEVVGGARCMPTTARWGQHTYMLRDAVDGRLDSIPPEVMGAVVASPEVWECTRLVISDRLVRAADRSLCLTMICEGLVDVAARNGAHELISLSPVTLMRALRQLGFGAERRGDPYWNDGDGRQYAVLSMPARPARPLLPRATHRPQPQPVHAPQVA
jgi:N-acyl-L-homoserine lactone synthetase